MKTIAQFVEDRITTLSDLKDALQTAMQLEFSTIPPYLCAQWSINSDAGGVGGMIEDIVVQEMYHFALAGNMLTAIGGVPSIANAAFIPSYPTNVLPGGILQKLAVDLKPLTPDQVQVFMQIEYPEFPPVALVARTGPATIGDFYDAIVEGFTTVNPAINASAFAVNSGEATPIKSIADAQAAIQLIKGEGEGTEGSPNQPPTGNATFAHYYVFKEIYTEKTLVQDAAGHWSFTGAPIPFPTWFDFQQSTVTPSPSLAFNQALSQLLIGLQTCWTSGARPSIGAMFTLQSLGTDLIQQGIRPEFLWAPPSA
ncbi:ferritin-like protein [Bradyrhizobium sp. Arg816]|uniref:ferritin-like domain-containing protein n=1 Tax=Bradyrhizobium sp. Arg816 TaxID=2998491 RepID=UPI00249EE15C|nr:ferritin-like protein [Bradyrhizobium sp. Arg816]MDI3563943.1 ferritin-like protein [Bradyrhizobium sp. Arg816]